MIQDPLGMESETQATGICIMFHIFRISLHRKYSSFMANLRLPVGKLDKADDVAGRPEDYT